MIISCFITVLFSENKLQVNLKIRENSTDFFTTLMSREKLVNIQRIFFLQLWFHEKNSCKCDGFLVFTNFDFAGKIRENATVFSVFSNFDFTRKISDFIFTILG